MEIITFNSYKGGACRTTTCYNSLPYIAQKLDATSKQPVLVFDIDLDSMGLTSIFNADKPVVEQRKKKNYSTHNLFVNDSGEINENLRNKRMMSIEDGKWYFDNFQKVGGALGLEDDGSVLFLGADMDAASITDDQYLPMLESSPLVRLVMTLKYMPEANRPKAIIFDCAAGMQPSTLVAFTLTDCSVMCMRPTLQFRMGTRDYLIDKIPAEIKNARKHRQNRRVILLPTSVSSLSLAEDEPNKANAKKELVNLRDTVLKDIMVGLINKIYSEEDFRGGLGYTLVTDMMESENYGIPEIERFKWQESLLFKLDELWTEQEKLLRTRYEMLADIITKQAVGD